MPHPKTQRELADLVDNSLKHETDPARQVELDKIIVNIEARVPRHLDENRPGRRPGLCRRPEEAGGQLHVGGRDRTAGAGEQVGNQACGGCGEDRLGLLNPDTPKTQRPRQDSNLGPTA